MAERLLITVYRRPQLITTVTGPIYPRVVSSWGQSQTTHPLPSLLSFFLGNVSLGMIYCNEKIRVEKWIGRLEKPNAEENVVADILFWGSGVLRVRVSWNLDGVVSLLSNSTIPLVAYLSVLRRERLGWKLSCKKKLNNGNFSFDRDEQKTGRVIENKRVWLHSTWSNVFS